MLRANRFLPGHVWHITHRCHQRAVSMARPVRIEYPAAIDHVICRGNTRQTEYRDDHHR